MGRKQVSESNGKVVTDSVDQGQDGDGKKIELEKNIGLLGGMSFVVGTVIGSGIFISPTGIARGSGSVALSLIAWLVCGLISLTGALTFCELGSYIRKSGTIYIYLFEAFGPVMAFLFSWSELLVRAPASAAVIAMTFAQYLLAPLFDDGCEAAPNQLRMLTAITLVLFLTGVNVYNAKIGTQIQIIFTIAKVGALLLIIIGGFVMMGQGYTEFLASGFENSESNVGRVAMGFYSGMFAYAGWERLPALYEEMRNPDRNIPISLVGGMLMVIVLYFLANVSYFTVMNVDDLLESSAVAYTWGRRVIPAASWILPLCVAASTFGSVNSFLVITSRISFVAAREGHLPSSLAMLHPTRLTPGPSIIMQAILVIIYVLPGDIGSLINALVFVQTFFTGMVGVALIVLRKTQADVEKPIMVPLIIPIIFIVSNVFLIIMPLIMDPQWEFLFAVLFTLAGLIFYIPLCHFKKKLPGMDAVTTFIQNFCVVCLGSKG